MEEREIFFFYVILIKIYVYIYIIHLSIAELYSTHISSSQFTSQEILQYYSDAIINISRRSEMKDAAQSLIKFETPGM